ncbi:hypothetical protein JXA12_01795 [Candidatus Woesearchaeota archaeon]|nr:hypothetical protein [Candidatus Woesearchaeota archaeon]
MWGRTVALAEIIGVMLGDGCLYLDYREKYHTIITLHDEEEDYALYVQGLFGKFFGYSFLIRNVP